MTSVAFQSILRKQIRKLPKILKSAKIIQNYSILFIRVLSGAARGLRRRTRRVRGSLEVRHLPHEVVPRARVPVLAGGLRAFLG